MLKRSWDTSKASTTLEIYTLPMPQNQRETAEKLSQMLTYVGELKKTRPEPPLLTQQIQ